jgi:hypothetical protein
MVEVRDLLPGEIEAAVGVLSRGMRDNPMNVAMLGSDEAQRERLLARIFTSLFRLSPAQTPLVAVDDTITGRTGSTEASPPTSLRPSRMSTTRRRLSAGP